MNVKFLVDENIGKPITLDLAKLLRWHRPQAEVIHLNDFMEKSGVSDDKWIPKAAEENAIIITGDSAKKSNRNPLPRICRNNRVRHVLFSRAFCQRPQFEKARAIIVVWPELLLKVTNSPPGSRFKIWQGDHHPKLVSTK